MIYKNLSRRSHEGPLRSGVCASSVNFGFHWGKKQFVMGAFWLPFLLLALLSCSESKKSKTLIDSRVDSLMSLMTLEEKIGQLNLPGAGDIVTGQAASSDIAKKIEK